MEACSVSGVTVREETAPGQEGEQKAGICLMSLFEVLKQVQFFGRRKKVLLVVFPMVVLFL